MWQNLSLIFKNLKSTRWLRLLAHGEPKEEKEKWQDLLANEKTRCIVRKKIR